MLTGTLSISSNKHTLIAQERKQIFSGLTVPPLVLICLHIVAMYEKCIFDINRIKLTVSPFEMRHVIPNNVTFRQV